MNLKRSNNLKFIIKQIFTFISFITGIIGYSTLIISYFLPWYLARVGYWGGGVITSVFYSYTPYWPYNNSSYSLLLGSVYGLLMTIILILSWKRNEYHIFSSFSLLGILTTSVLIEYTISIRHRPSITAIPESTVLYENYLIGYFLNLIGVIIILFMIGISLLGFFLFERTKKSRREQETRKNHSISIISSLLLTLIIIPFFLFKTNWIYYFDIIGNIWNIALCLIFVTIVLLSIIIIDPKNHIKSLIPSFLITFFTLILVRLLIDLKKVGDFKLIITHLFYFEIIFVLLILSYMSFEEIPRSSIIQILDYNKKRKSKKVYLINIFYIIIIMFLVYTVISWWFFRFGGIYNISSISQEILIIPFIIYLITLILVLFTLVNFYKEDKHDLNHKNLPLNIIIMKKKSIRRINLYIFIIILLLTFFTYLILRFYDFITEDMTILVIDTFNDPEIILFRPRIFLIFVFLNLIPVLIYIALQVSRIMYSKKSTKNFPSYEE